MKRYYVGLDVHTTHIQATMIDDKRRVINEAKLEPKEEAIEWFLSGIPKHMIEVVMEACGIWNDLYDYLERRCYRVRLANPLKTRLIAEARIKTDKIDSRILPELLRADLIAESYVSENNARYRKCISDSYNV